MTYTEKVVDQIVNFKKESIPKDVIEHAQDIRFREPLVVH